MFTFQSGVIYKIVRFLLCIYSIVLFSSPVVIAGVIKNNHHIEQYEIVSGDTWHKISKRHGMTVKALLDINGIKFIENKDGLIKVGEIIYVPAMQYHELPLSATNDLDKIGSVDIEMRFAEQAKRIGETYSISSFRDVNYRNDVDLNVISDNRSYSNVVSFTDNELNNLKKQVKNIFESKAKDYVSSAFNDFDNVEVGLALGDDFSVKNYAINVLSPLVNQPSNMLFIQGGGRYDDGSNRAVLNFGVGQRHFVGSWMIGYNAFVDHELINHHSRLGVGSEAWTDYTKLSWNIYTPLSDWKESKKIENYQERPARGFDVNAKYYLPKYPNLALSAKVEQYLGQEVAISGNQDRIDNPYAGTFGIEWQPISLLKVGVDHRIAKGGKSDTAFNIGIEWKIGASFNDITKHHDLKLAKGLQGIRNDFVERNYDLTLEYKEKERVVLIEHPSIVGKPEQQIFLAPQVSISHGRIVKYEWMSPAVLLYAGVENISNKNSRLKLPNIMPSGLNSSLSFPLYLTVTDEKGRVYRSQQILVTVLVESDGKNDAGTDPTANPRVNDLRMLGKLEAGQALTGRYKFDANGGNSNDKSTYAWGNLGETVSRVSTGAKIITSGQVPALDLTAADIGTVKELSVQACNGLALTGNTLTVDSAMGVEGGDETTGGGVGGETLDSSNIHVSISYVSTAIKLTHGVDGGSYTGSGDIRPVANVDEMTAMCQIAGESSKKPCDERFNLSWYVNGIQVSGATGFKFTPSAADQGYQVVVEANLKS
ncbi:MAG: inverse autotransporter beta domain-containing protein [Plesiomonas sp.]|uniref:inverse autotransporter beta domain-containing protein n=1 Tax=Plesiomonas sp. TaxID=2486279 RepID=UPI003F3C2885